VDRVGIGYSLLPKEFNQLSLDVGIKPLMMF